MTPERRLKEIVLGIEPLNHSNTKDVSYFKEGIWIFEYSSFTNTLYYEYELIAKPLCAEFNLTFDEIDLLVVNVMKPITKLPILRADFGK